MGRVNRPLDSTLLSAFTTVSPLYQLTFMTQVSTLISSEGIYVFQISIFVEFEVTAQIMADKDKLITFKDIREFFNKCNLRPYDKEIIQATKAILKGRPALLSCHRYWTSYIYVNILKTTDKVIF